MQKTPELVLTEREGNVLEKIARLSGMDCWFHIMDNNAAIEDLEEGTTLNLKEGIATLHEGMIDYQDYDMDEEEIAVFKGLLERLGLPEEINDTYIAPQADTKRTTFIVIDGSSMLSTCYYALMPMEIKIQKEERDRIPLYPKLMHASDGTYTNAIYGMVKILVQILHELKPDCLAIVFDRTRDTFRRKMYANYKAQRKETPGPLKDQFALIQAILKECNMQVLVNDQYEADDLAGSIVQKFADRARIRLITKDRDYLQLVDDEKDVRCWITADKEKADDFRKRYGTPYGSDGLEIPGALSTTMEFTETTVYGEKGVFPKLIPDLKAIEGDTADNIPGVKGVSSAAAPLLLEYGSLEALYDAIHDCENEKTEKELAKFWKESLGIKRSPMKALKENEEIAKMSKTLATIRTDVPVPENLTDYRCSNIDADWLNASLESLDIKTVRL